MSASKSYYSKCNISYFEYYLWLLKGYGLESISQKRRHFLKTSSLGYPNSNYWIAIKGFINGFYPKGILLKEVDRFCSNIQVYIDHVLI